MDTPSNIWSDLENDDYLSQFLQEGNLNNIVEDQAVKLTTSEQLKRLTAGVNKLEDQLVKDVDVHYNDFISLGESIDGLHLSTSNLKLTGQDLSSSVNNLNDMLLEPLNRIEKNKEILTRIYNTSEILICIIRTQHLAKQLVPNQCLSEKALLIAELEENNDDVDLSGINVIEKELKQIEREKTKIKIETRKSLITALEENNYNEVEKNVKTLVNLRVLQNELNQQLEDSLSHIEKRIQTILNVQTLTSSGDTDPNKTKITSPGRITGSTFPQVNVATFRARLWKSWSEILNNFLYPKCVQMFLLQSVTRTFNEVLDDKISNIASLFWSESWEIMARFLIKLSRESTFVKQTLEAEYPKLLRLHSELYTKLHNLVFSSPYIRWISGNPFPPVNVFANQFENAYLSLSVSRLLDNIEGMFSHNSRPTNENVDAFIRTATNELNISLVDENLCITIARNIDKAIRLFCIKSDQLISFDQIHDRIFESPSIEQKTNIEMTNTVYYLKQQVHKQLLLNANGNLPNDCENQIMKSLQHDDNITNKSITQISNAITGAIESIIVKIHLENFYSENCGTTSSSYMDELKAFIVKSYREYICLFDDKKSAKKFCLKIATRTINFFLRHVCIIRPLGTIGRQKLAADFLHMESAIAPLCSNLNMLGECYEVLKAFRPLLTCEDGKEVVKNKGNIPNSLVILYLFSYAPENMLSPHQNCKWSTITFSNWLDNHTSEADVLELISNTLQNYERIIKKENGSLHYIYNVMINLIEETNN